MIDPAWGWAAAVGVAAVVYGPPLLRRGASWVRAWCIDRHLDHLAAQEPEERLLEALRRVHRAGRL